MSTSLCVARSLSSSEGDAWISLLAAMANRHGLIAGATGTGKSVTLRVLAEGFSRIGVPVFMADVKGDLAGISQPGVRSERIAERLSTLGVTEWTPHGYPSLLWDPQGERGHPIRTTVSELGPVLLARLLNLNEVQSGVLSVVFRVADDAGMLLLDLKDLQAMLTYVGENARQFTLEYGAVSVASIGAIQRALLALRESGGAAIFGEPALDIDDLLRTDATGRGVINILSAERLLQSPLVYSTLLMWILSELFERLPEEGDLEKPKLVFFFDEAHLLFRGAPKPFIERIEQVVRLIRSKGVGVFFVSQSPLDIEDAVLGQLGNRVQHALRAFTAQDQKAVRATAETFRTDDSQDLQRVIGELAIGEAVVSFLGPDGAPSVARRAAVIPPQSRLGAITPEERQQVLERSPLFGKYEEVVDRESAYEILKRRMEGAVADEESASAPLPDRAGAGGRGGTRDAQPKRTRQGPLEALVVSLARSIGSQLGRSISRGVFGSLSGRPRRR